jgi:hypothetical protein
MATTATLLAGLVGGAATSQAAEVEPGLDWTTIVRQRPAERINVLTVDSGRVRGVLSNERIAGRERVSAMARRVQAVAGVNGGFFGPSGDPVGVLAIDGELLSEPIDGRSALLMSALERPVIAPVRYRGRLTVNGRSREIDGIDRTRGLIPACGGRGGDLPTIHPNSLLTCTDSSELVVLSPRYGARPPAEGGVEAIVRDGRVTRLRPPGVGGVPREGVLLTGSGDAARFLRNTALPRSRADIRQDLLVRGQRVDLAGLTVVGGGPRILRAGRVAVAARAEGFAPVPSFFQAFVGGRQPRTLAGVRADGTLLLVTVDGRAPGWSAGMTLPEAARLMRSLGARDALNLDGGGSSTMTVRGEVVNRPSDDVERRVSDGLFVMP